MPDIMPDQALETAVALRSRSAQPPPASPATGPAYTKPRHAKALAQLFNVSLLITVPVNLLGAVVSYGISTGEEIIPGLFSLLHPANVTLVIWAGAGVALLTVGLTLASYLLSLDFRRCSRPTKRVHVLFASFFLYLAGAGLGSLKVPLDAWWFFVVAAVVALLLPLLVHLTGGALGKAFARSAEGLLRADAPGAARAAARTSLQFLPANKPAEQSYGLALAQCGRGVAALPYLLTHPADIPSLPPKIVRVLVDLYEKAGEQEHALLALETIQRVEPSPQQFERLMKKWLALGRKQEVLQQLRALPAQERKGWYDTMRDLVFELEDVEQCRAFCREVELAEGPPYARAHNYYKQLLERNPTDLATHRLVIDLGQRRGDAEQSARLLEQMVEMQGGDGVEDRRKLVSYYWTKGDRAGMLRHLEAIQLAGRATLQEKLQMMDESFTERNYARVEQLVTQDHELKDLPRALTTLAFALRDSGRMAESLEAIQACRTRGGDSDALDKLEQDIATETLGAEIRDLSRQLEATPGDIHLNLQLAERQLQNREEHAAADLIRQLLRNEPTLRPCLRNETHDLAKRYRENSALYELLGDWLLEDQSFPEAFSMYQSAAERHPQPKEALHTYAGRVLALSPANAPALLTEVQHYAARGDHEQTLAMVDGYYAAHGEAKDNHEILTMDFNAALGSGNLPRAESVGKQLLASGPGDWALLRQMATLAVDLRHYDDGAEYLERARQLDSANDDYETLLRDLHRKRKRDRIETLELELASGKNDSAIHEELGDLYHEIAEYALAMTQYQRAIKSDPSQRIARAKLAFVLAYKGLHLDAHEIIQETELRTDLLPPELALLKDSFYRTATLMDDAAEYEAALDVFRRVMRVEAGYRDVVDHVERLHRTVKRKARDTRNANG